MCGAAMLARQAYSAQLASGQSGHRNQAPVRNSHAPPSALGQPSGSAARQASKYSSASRGATRQAHSGQAAASVTDTKTSSGSARDARAPAVPRGNARQKIASAAQQQSDRRQRPFGQRERADAAAGQQRRRHGAPLDEADRQQCDADDGDAGAVGLGLVQAQQDADGSNEQQHRDIGDQARVVAARGLAAEGAGHRLRFLAARQAPRADPERADGQRDPDQVGGRRRVGLADQAANVRISTAPSQYGSGPPWVSDAPATFCSSQSAALPCAMVHMRPKPAASCGHRSWPNSPGRVNASSRQTSAQRGRGAAPWAEMCAGERRGASIMGQAIRPATAAAGPAAPVGVPGGAMVRFCQEKRQPRLPS